MNFELVGYREEYKLTPTSWAAVDSSCCQSGFVWSRISVVAGTWFFFLFVGPYRIRLTTHGLAIRCSADRNVNSTE